MGNIAQEVEPPVSEEEIAQASKEIEQQREAPPEKVEKEAATKAEDKEDVKADEKKPEKKHKYTDEEGNPLVRLDALHEARSQLKQTRAEMARLAQEQQQRQAVLDQRLQMLYAAQNPPPNPETDPIGAHTYELAQVKRAQNELIRRAELDDARNQQAAQISELVNWARAEASQFESETPDFQDAYNAVRNKRVSELRAMGLNGPDLEKTLVQDEIWVLQHAAQTGRNPAEVLYSMAKAIGYTGKKDATNVPAIPEQKIEAMQRGLAASKTLEGGASAGKPSAEQLATMSEDEFAEVMKKYGSLERVLS